MKKTANRILCVMLALAFVLGLGTAALAADGGFGGVPDGRYAYVEGSAPGEGEIAFDYWTDTLTWTGGSAVLTGNALKFFQGMFIADHPVTDWFGGAPKDTEGYLGDVAGNVLVDFADGKLSRIRVDAGTTRTVAVLARDIAAPTLEISGATRGRPNLLQSCITLMGSVNALYLTAQGDVILDNLTIGGDGEGGGLSGDKIGGDTFVVGTVSIGGAVEWHGRMGVITALGTEPGTLETGGYDISMTGGSNVGRVGRELNIVSNGGDISIGAAVTTDSTRGGLLPNADTSADGLIVSTSGVINAGTGDVTIGTNTEKIVTVDVIGGVRGANVTIKPTDKGEPTDVKGYLGDVTATGSIEIAVGDVSIKSEEESLMALNGFSDYADIGDREQAVGDLTAENGSITFSAKNVAGTVGEMSAPNGTVSATYETVERPVVTAPAEPGFGGIPAGTYAYTNDAPAEGQLRFDYDEGRLVWDGGGAVLSGDELAFFRSLFQSDLPAYDWLAGAARETEGYAGNLDRGLILTFSEEGRLSRMRLDSGLVQVAAALSASITDDTLVVSGETRGQPNLLQSCVTLYGSCNALHLTDRGNVVLSDLKIGHDENGVGLSSEKIGGDTFIAGTVTSDGVVEWLSRYANLQPLGSATLATNGQDIIMGGASIGRVGRELNIVSNGGDIMIGREVSVDYGRRDPLTDPSTGTLTVSTSGLIDAGTGDVIVGTNTERVVQIDVMGDIRGNNITVKPTNNGTPTGVTEFIGDITAAGDVEIVVDGIKGIGTITAGGTVTTDYGETKEPESVPAEATSATVLVNGTAVTFDAYNIGGYNYFKIRDIAYQLNGTEKQFSVYWMDDAAYTVITLNSGMAYTPVGTEMAGPGAATSATPSTWAIYLDSAPASFEAYNIEGSNYFKLRDVAAAFDFGVDWDEATQTIRIDTSEGYAE